MAGADELRPLTVQDLRQAELWADGDDLTPYLLAVALDRMPDEVLALDFGDSVELLEALTAQRERRGGATWHDDGRVTVTLATPLDARDELTLRRPLLRDMYAGPPADAAAGECEGTLRLVARLAGVEASALDGLAIGDYDHLHHVTALFALPRRSAPKA